MPLDVSAFEIPNQPETQVFKLDVQTYQFIMNQQRLDQLNKPKKLMQKCNKSILEEGIIPTTLNTMQQDFEKIYKQEIKQQAIQNYTDIIFTSEEVQEYYKNNFPIRKLTKFLVNGYHAIILGVGDFTPLVEFLKAHYSQNMKGSRVNVLNNPTYATFVKYLNKNIYDLYIIPLFTNQDAKQCILKFLKLTLNLNVSIVFLIQFTIGLEFTIYKTVKDQMQNVIFLEASSLIANEEESTYQCLQQLDKQSSHMQKTQIVHLLSGNIEHTTNLLKLQILCTFLMLQKADLQSFVYVSDILKALKQLYSQYTLIQDTQILQAMNNFTAAETPQGRVVLIDRNAESFRFLGTGGDIDQILQTKFDSINFNFK